MTVLFGLFLFRTLTLLTSVPINDRDKNGSLNQPQSDPILEDARLTMPQLLTKYGYPSETHKVQTEDGYILTLYRIPYGRQCGPNEKRRPPILLQHGLLLSSLAFIITGPDKGLGYILADNCYDVWLGNSRGNAESKEHISLDVREPKYWNFSWHEMGVHDLPAVFERIKRETGQSRLHYAGFSQGGAQYCVLCSIRPDMCRNVISYHALAPAVFWNHTRSPFFRFTALFDGLSREWFDVAGLGEFVPRNGLIIEFGRQVCQNIYPELCAHGLFTISGYNPYQLNITQFPSILGHVPAGASIKQIFHFGQEIHSGKFQQYDYGKARNLKHYGNINAPEYNLEKVITPTIVYYGTNDLIIAPEDVLRLIRELPNVVATYELPEFNHVDLLWAIDVPTLMYDKLLKHLNDFESKLPSKQKMLP